MTGALAVRGLSVSFGGAPVLDALDLEVAAGAVTGLIGPNGAGKTTLLDAVTGQVRADGEVWLGEVALHRLPAHARVRRGVARTFQSLELFEDLDVEENLRAAAESAGRGGAPEPVLARLGLSDVRSRLPRTLPHAVRARVALGRALAARPEVLLLDEPAAGLDDAQREALVPLLRELAGQGTAVVLVDHDTDLVLRASDVVHVLHAGRLLASGPPEQVRADRDVARAYLGAGDHLPRPPGPDRPDRPAALVADGLSASYGDVAVLHDVSLRVGAGEVVALLGRNGAGKSTLMRTLAGLHRPAGGRLEVLGGPPAAAERVARRGAVLVPQERGLLRRLTGAQNLRLARATGPVDEVLDRFPDLGGRLDRPVAELSGGQQQQLAMARALLRRPRLLLVDELSLGLAPQVVEHLLAVLRELADAGTAVLLVEQHASLALSVADRACVLDRGRVVLSGTSAELAADPAALRASYLS